MSDLFGSVVEILNTRFDIDPSIVTPTSTYDDIDLDSLSEIDLGVAINKQFDVEITDDEIANSSTIGDVVSVLADKLAAAGNAADNAAADDVKAA